jgi:peptidoglycan/xylan/chitin deacetylase (PgdA/CDA1 family)
MPAVSLLVVPDRNPRFKPIVHRVAATPRLRLINGVATRSRVVALTFDLDMTPIMVGEVQQGTSWFNADALAYMRAQHVHATMFMTGLWAEVYPTIARAIAQDPNFEIGNHTFSHPAFHAPCYELPVVDPSDQAVQIRMAQQAIRWVTGVAPRYFRFPGGCYDPRAVNLVHAAGLIPVEWTVNSIDAFNPDAAQIADTVISQVKPGSVVIMHLQAGKNAPATGQALRQIIPALKGRGYRFLTISELLGSGTPIQPPPGAIVQGFPVPSTPSPTAPPA